MNLSALGALSAVSLGVFLVAFVLLVVLGFHVVTRHPAKYDPARDAARYTRPALALVVVGILAFFVGSVSGIAWIVQTLSQ